MIRVPLPLAILLAALAAIPLAAATVPAGFTDVSLFNVPGPTALAFTPDGRMLVTTQGGDLRVYKSGSLLAPPALDLTAVCTDSERGLLGVAVDPDFAANRYVYLFYTYDVPSPGGCVNRVSRFTFGTGDTINPATELILVDNMPSPAGNHNAGDVHFGRDGFLYISIGDGGCDWQNDSGCAGQNDASRDQHVLTGKILRITKTGGIPATNPFQGAGTARCNVTGQTTAGNKCQETFAWGLRNPFRFTMDPNNAGTRFFINDVGQGAWEEIDLGQSGVDYGWNCREGAHTNSTTGKCSPAPAGMVNPFFEYSHSSSVPGTSVSGCGSITGGAFVPDGLWPGYDAAFLFGDYNCGHLFKLVQGGGGAWSATDFASGTGGFTAMIFGPHGNGQALYYLTYLGGGQVHRVSFDAPGNEPPVAAVDASPRSGAVPLAVAFNGSGSVDPDAGDVLMYFWDFGDGGPVQETTSATVNHTYTAAGVLTATLRVRDDSFAFSAPASVVIQPGNTAPSPTIVSPAAGQTFRVGQTITLTGSATDTQDGTLPASSLSWTVLLNHNGSHTHPWFSGTGNNLTFTAPAPEDLDATDGSFLDVRLAATDSGGLTGNAQRNFQPSKITLTLDTDPDGLDLTVNGRLVTAPYVFTSWESWGIDVVAPNQSDGVVDQVFSSWSDSGAQAHRIVTPAAPTTYTATFQPSATTGPVDFHTLIPCRLVDTRLAGPALAAGSTRTFTAAGSCGIPATAKAIAANVTVVAPSSAGTLRMRAGGTLAVGTSVIDFAAGQVRSNNALIGLGAAGEFLVFTGMPSGSVHLAVDVAGWFE
jgi:glucose/arabinose dehydrogenase/PKD repeat protein